MGYLMSSNNDLVGCPACKGRKTVLGLGSFTKDCDTCKGIGWIEKPISDLDEDEFLQSANTDFVTPEEFHQDVKINNPYDLIPVRKKPGPKPKIKVE